MLVENRHSFTISIVREHSTDLSRTVRLLSQVAGLDPKQVEQTVERHRGEPAYRPIVIVEDASLAQVAAVRARRLESELPDVVVEEVPTRRYPADALAAHLFGYVGEANDTQVAGGAAQGAIIGQQGLEKAYNDLLMGRDGARVVVVNSLGREIRTLEEVPPVEGRRLQLTIDADMQRAAEDGFRHAGFNGAALVLDPRNGEVLTYVSLPAYDPNDFAVGIERAKWAALNTDRLRPLQNRVMQGRYSPGSTFKIVVATAALEEGIVDPDFRVTCNGGAYVLRPLLQVSPQGRARLGGHAARAREVVQRLLLHPRQHARRRQDPQVGREARDGGQDRHRSAERAGQHRAVHRMEAPPDR